MLLYGVDQFIADDLFCSVGDVIHPPYPLHLIFGFELFGDAFFFGDLFDQAIIHHGCILVDVGKVIVEFALGQQVVIKDSVMVLQIASAALSHLSVRSVLLPAAEVSTGHPHPQMPISLLL